MVKIFKWLITCIYIATVSAVHAHVYITSIDQQHSAHYQIITGTLQLYNYAHMQSQIKLDLIHTGGVHRFTQHVGLQGYVSQSTTLLAPPPLPKYQLEKVSSAVCPFTLICDHECASWDWVCFRQESINTPLVMELIAGAAAVRNFCNSDNTHSIIQYIVITAYLAIVFKLFLLFRWALVGVTV